MLILYLNTLCSKKLLQVSGLYDPHSDSPTTVVEKRETNRSIELASVDFGLEWFYSETLL